MEAILVAFIVSGNARFTPITPEMIRMEWYPTGQFEDRPSMLFIDRDPDLPRVRPQVEREGGWLIVRTGKLTLRYRERSGRFGPENLSVTFDLNGKPVTWRPGTEDTGNLHGTRKSLDNVSGAAPLEPGLLSRNGWVVLDDSRTPLMPNGEDSWPVPRGDEHAIDWYFLGYGHDYKRALHDFTRVAGRIPLPPRFVFGAWWSRYWPYTEQQVRELIAEFDSHDVPLDVLVLDMDWHKEGWSGYSWRDEYFADPAGFLRWVHEQGLRVTLNLHPGFSIEKHESRYAEFVKALGRDPADGAAIAYDHFNERFARAYFRQLIRPLEKMGVDFWWLDYGGHSPLTKIPGLNPTLWCNAMHCLHMQSEHPDRRPLMFSRWGGLANHRYQIGFSGDTHSTWESLAFQPYMTATAGNAAFPFWSHDIGGHYLGPVEGELYARWIQFAVFNPVLRTHATVNAEAERRIWTFSDEVFDAARKAFHLRYELIPYIYTAARQCYEDGVPLCRPLYYDWPELEEAYRETGVYRFGDDLLVAPITAPRGDLSASATTRVWLPGGTWIHWFTGEAIDGPTEVSLASPLNEIPVFAAAGAVIPAQPKMRRTGEKLVDPLILHVFPGPARECSLYEDDGRTPAYKTGAYARTTMHHEYGDREQVIRIGAAEGRYTGMPEERSYELRARGVFAPSKVTVNGKELAKSSPDGEAGWWFDADLFCVVVRLPRHSVRDEVRVAISYPWSEADQALWGQGLAGRVRLLEAIADGLGEATPDAIKAAVQIRPWLAKDWRQAIQMAHQIVLSWDALLQQAMQAEVADAAADRVAKLVLGGSCGLTIASAGQGSSQVVVRSDLSICPPFGPVPGAEGHIALTVPAGWRATGEQAEAKRQDSLTDGRPMGVEVKAEPIAEPKPGVVKAEYAIHCGKRVLKKSMSVPVLPGIDKWWVIGPFENPTDWGVGHVFPPEKNIDLAATYEGDGGAPIAWQKAERQIGPGSDLTDEFAIDLHAFYGVEHSTCVAYGLTYLHSPRDMDASLALGSDDGVAVWLNGQEVHRLMRWRPYASKQDRVPIQLKAGSNTLLLKVNQGGGGWGFGAHVETPDGQLLPEVRASLEP